MTQFQDVIDLQRRIQSHFQRRLAVANKGKKNKNKEKKFKAPERLYVAPKSVGVGDADGVRSTYAHEHPASVLESHFSVADSQKGVRVAVYELAGYVTLKQTTDVGPLDGDAD
jgi:hypothetical protein